LLGHTLNTHINTHKVRVGIEINIVHFEVTFSIIDETVNLTPGVAKSHHSCKLLNKRQLLGKVRYYVTMTLLVLTVRPPLTCMLHDLSEVSNKSQYTCYGLWHHALG